MELSTFDIASDAFASFKVKSRKDYLIQIVLMKQFCLISWFSSAASQDLLTRHKIMCADFLENNYDRVGFKALI